MRSWRSEFMSLATVLTIPVLVAVSFPYQALSFRARPAQARKAGFAAFVTLTAEEEDVAVKAAKTSWRGEGGIGDSSRVDLRLGELPEPDSSSVLSIDARNQPVFERSAEARLPAYCPSQAAGRPSALPQDDVPPTEPAFSRSDLLTIH